MESLRRNRRKWIELLARRFQNGRFSGFSSTQIPQTRSVVGGAGGRGEMLAIRAKVNASHPAGVALENRRLLWFGTCQVPKPKRLVLASRGQRFAVGRESDTAHRHCVS